MSRLTVYEGPSPATPPAGAISIYAKIDGRLYWMTSDGTEIPFYPVGAGTGDLLANGTVPLTSNWDVGSYEITMLRGHFDTTTGQPFTVASNDRVVGLNADMLDGYQASDFQLAGTYLTSDDIDTLAELNALITDATLGDASDFATAAQGAKVDLITITQAVDLDQIETRVNQLDAAVVLVGSWDASAGTFPGGGTAQTGESYIISVAGTVDGVDFSINDRIVALTDDASTTVYANNWLKLDYTDQVLSVAGLTGAILASALRTAINVEDGATADQTDSEIETAYNNQVAVVSQSDAEAGVSASVYRWTPQRVSQAIAALTASSKNNVQTGTTYTIQSSDNGKNIIFNNAADIAVTLPDTLDLNFQCTVIQVNTGIPTVTPNTDTINGAGTGVAPVEQWKAMYLTQYAATEWLALL
jgi:hypothetical protein